MTRIVSGQLTAQGLSFGIVAARFNGFLVEQLVDGAKDTLIRHGASEQKLTLVNVPGSFEIPLACRELARHGGVDAIVALGVIIRGATSHYDLVCSEAARGVAAVSHEIGIPIGFGVVTADTIEQAIERCGTKAGNKGVDAAMAAIEMTHVVRELRGEGKR